MKSEPDPHCERCDFKECDGSPMPGTVESFEKQAGIKPQAPIMRSAWEHSLMVWCKSKWNDWLAK